MVSGCRRRRRQDGIDFLVMEYLDGQTSAHRLEKGALPLDQALTIAIEIATVSAVYTTTRFLSKDDAKKNR